MLHKQIDTFKKKIIELKKINTHLRYMPGGIGAMAAAIAQIIRRGDLQEDSEAFNAMDYQYETKDRLMTTDELQDNIEDYDVFTYEGFDYDHDPDTDSIFSD